MGRKTPPLKNYPSWTEARFWAFLRSAIRKAHVRWPPAQAVMKENRRPVTGKRHKWEHLCAMCNQWTPQKDIEKDHIVPTGSMKSFEEIGGFVERMFVAKEGYRKLCKTCHNKVTHGKEDSEE